MTTVLALETSGVQSSIALLEGDTLAFEFTLRHGRDLSRLLIPALDHSFKASGRDRSGVEIVAASVGPGSFTGLRIGVTAAKTLAYALKVPAAAVPTLAALAVGAPAAEGDIVIPIIDARRGEVFVSAFRLNGGTLDRLAPDSLLAVEDLPGFVSIGEDPGHRMVIASAGRIPEIDSVLEDIPGALTTDAYPQARFVAQLGAALASQGELLNPMDLLPSYLRRSYAEENAEAKLPPGASLTDL